METNESIALEEIADKLGNIDLMLDKQLKRIADALEYLAGAVEDGPLNPTYLGPIKKR